MNIIKNRKNVSSTFKFGIKNTLLGYNNLIKSDDFHIDLALKWLKKSYNAVDGNGFAAGYSLNENKWREAYPETTGYILETIIKYDINNRNISKFNVEKIKNWLLSIQNDDGSFPGGVGTIGNPSVFNTGQILIGLIEYYKLNKKDQNVLDSIVNACDWLISVQEKDGSWIKYSYNSIPHAYYTRVAYPLIETGKIIDKLDYIDAGKSQIYWTLSMQNKNGFFDYMGFTKENNQKPFTHTISYTLRGLLESFLLIEEQEILDKTKKTLDKLLRVYEIGKKLNGQYNSKWKAGGNYLCLTGNVQLAYIFIKYYKISKDIRFLNAAYKMIDDVKSKQILNHRIKNIEGGIPGSYPIFGNYMKFYFPNWAIKFFIDSLFEKKNSIDNLKKR